MSADTAALQERIAQALHGFEWDCAHDGSDGEWALSEAKPYYLSLAAAVLPIVEAEVRAAKAEAWDEAHEVGWNNADEYWRCDGLIPSYFKADTYPNPYRQEQ